jgi:RimJ/RimL family protein N-acetyltransferase
MKSFLASPKIILLPFDESYAGDIARWFYDPAYSDMFRHYVRPLTFEQFKQYPKVLGGEIFLIYHKELKRNVGYAQFVPDTKSNMAVYAGILLEKEVQDQSLSTDAFILMFNYVFNRLNFRKVIIEILASNKKIHQALLKYGCREEGRYFEEAFINGEFVDEVRLSITAPFFRKKFSEVLTSWGL